MLNNTVQDQINDEMPESFAEVEDFDLPMCGTVVANKKRELPNEDKFVSPNTNYSSSTELQSLSTKQQVGNHAANGNPFAVLQTIFLIFVLFLDGHWCILYLYLSEKNVSLIT